MKGHLSGTKLRVFLVWLQYTWSHVNPPAAAEQLGPTQAQHMVGGGEMNLAYFSMRNCSKIEINMGFFGLKNFGNVFSNDT